jgi:hypothetical protein
MPFTREDDLRLSIRMGLTKGLHLIRGIAEAIRLHLESAGWRIEPGPAIGGHSQLSGSGGDHDAGAN